MAVTKRPNGTWITQLRDNNGAWYPAKSFDTYKAAEIYETELKTLRDGGVKVKSRDMREYSMAQYWIRWSEECRTETSNGWKGSQDQMWRDHIEPVLGTVKLIEVEKSDVAQLMVKLKGKGLGGQMRLHIYGLLHIMMSAAVEVYEVRDTNPVVKRFKPEVIKPKRKFLKPVIAKEFLKDVSEHRLGAAFWIMTYCGFRTGEVQALRRKNIDFDDASITITEQWVRKEKIFGPLKNREPLTVPMPMALVKYLKKKLSPLMAPDAFVVTNVKGGMMNHVVLYKTLKALCETHQLPALSPHELRHTCSGLWLADGASEQDLKQIFNHESEKSTQRYIHNIDDRLREIANKGSKAKLRRVK